MFPRLMSWMKNELKKKSVSQQLFRSTLPVGSVVWVGRYLVVAGTTRKDGDENEWRLIA